jgi:hypothetical protein
MMLIRLWIGRMLWWFVKAGFREDQRIEHDHPRYPAILADETHLQSYIERRLKMRADSKIAIDRI